MQDGLLYMLSDVSTVNSSERLSQLVIPQSLVSSFIMFTTHTTKDTQVETDASCKQNDHISVRGEISFNIVRSALSVLHLIASAPWDSVSVGLVKLPLTENGYQYPLVCVDSSNVSPFSLVSKTNYKFCWLRDH